MLKILCVYKPKTKKKEGNQIMKNIQLIQKESRGERKKGLKNKWNKRKQNDNIANLKPCI